MGFVSIVVFCQGCRRRLRNRFDKKFNFFPDQIGRFGCTGCGRCSEACAGKIYIDEVLSKLESYPLI